MDAIINEPENILLTKIPKKKGRKPKNQKIQELNIKEEPHINTEEDNIILCLPITMNDINNDINNDIFINTDNNLQNKNEDTSTHNSIEIISTINQNNFINTNINKILTHEIKITPETKCWWCKNNFSTDNLQLPENYLNETFYCIGNFCSFNCMKSYNFDLNDLFIDKRNTLINFLYYKIYNSTTNIIPAPHWLTLIEYGGILSIDEFRLNSLINNKEYLILSPPIISKQIHIEESYKLTNKANNKNISLIEKILK